MSLYRGAELRWDAAEIDMAVPLSLCERVKKTQAVFQYRRQTAVASGRPEPWQQAEQHTPSLALAYNQLGFANYEAIEAFQLWRP